MLQTINQVIELSKLKKKINIKCSKNLFIKTDKNSLFRIIFNLFENAARYGTIIQISAKKNQDSLIIEIEDNGRVLKINIEKKYSIHFIKLITLEI